MGNGTTTSRTTSVDVSGITIPTAATLTHFAAKFHAAKHRVNLKWETGSELNVVGFNVWRKRGNGQWIMLNAKLIAAQNLGGIAGAQYAFADTQTQAAKTYRYKLELVRVGGTREWSAVKRVTVP